MSTQNNIEAKDYTLKEILSEKKYSVDYFQREYSWNKENITQLIYDLTEAFSENYRPEHITKNVSEYSSYYMGPIVLYEKEGVSSIIDGQQRITSLTLLLIYLNSKSDKKINAINNMIYSDSYGEQSFNIQIPEREACLKALFNSQDCVIDEDTDESVKNMIERYNDIVENFPIDDFQDKKLESFIYWVIDKIVLVRIVTNSDKNAYMIFETMNDRGLSLSSTDMLKGFILSKYSDVRKRKTQDEEWKKQMSQLNYYDKNADAQFFQSWLRAQFAETVRQGKAGSMNMDFENIGMRFHYWFRENFDKNLLKEAINGSIENFMDTNYKFFLKCFLKIKEAEKTFLPNLHHVYYAACWGIAESLKYPLFLAPLNINDSEDICIAKIETVAKYLDSFCVKRSVNFRIFGQSSIRYTMSQLTKAIRNKSIEELKEILTSEANKQEESFENLKYFRLQQKNKFFVKYFLCRLTSYIEEQTGKPDNFVNYLFNPDCKPFEIEHIWCDHMELHSDEFDQENEFELYRNNIGDLVLLPNGSNQSYGDLPYDKKQPHYIKENLLAMSLCSQAYENNPNFVNFVNNSKLPFIAHNNFKKDDILDRCELYKQISQKIW